jgi:hypothetical protein
MVDMGATRDGSRKRVEGMKSTLGSARQTGFIPSLHLRPFLYFYRLFLLQLFFRETL